MTIYSIKFVIEWLPIGKTVINSYVFTSVRSPGHLEVPSTNNSQELDEDGLPLPPWKQDIRAGQTPIQV